MLSTPRTQNPEPRTKLIVTPRLTWSARICLPASTMSSMSYSILAASAESPALCSRQLGEACQDHLSYYTIISCENLVSTSTQNYGQFSAEFSQWEMKLYERGPNFHVSFWSWRWNILKTTFPRIESLCVYKFWVRESNSVENFRGPELILLGNALSSYQRK